MVTAQTIAEEVGALVRVPPGRTVTIAWTTTDLADATFTVEYTRNRDVFATAASFAGTAGSVSGSVAVTNDSANDWYVRAKAVEVAAGTFAGTVDVTFTVPAVKIGELRDTITDTVVATITDEGVEFVQPITSATVTVLTATLISGTAGSLIVPEYADNAGALADGQPVGALWKTAAGVVAAVVAA